jgi:hypothetical protein
MPAPTDDRPAAPCRIFHAETGQLVAGTGDPIPEGVPLRYEDPELQPSGSSGEDVVFSSSDQDDDSAAGRARTRPRARGPRRST